MLRTRSWWREPARRKTSLSDAVLLSKLYLRDISSTSHSILQGPRGSRFTWFAASAERKFILKVEKLMNPSVFGYFSQFSNLPDFSWFWDVLAIIFDSLAWFPARGRFQIDRASNFKLIQIFVFIWCSCVDPTSYPTTLNIPSIFMKLRWADRKLKFEGLQIN